MDGPHHAAYGLGGRGQVRRGTGRWHRPIIHAPSASPMRPFTHLSRRLSVKPVSNPPFRNGYVM
uniref:Uncharacterized protein n=1 Tax=Nonomuraea gerenzanensis TaxID=93944 RepID=A0A1M4DVC4_9ACTN|nr:hypothetical protein BN4615_P23 [Nonomuraea gerenzanensis]